MICGIGTDLVSLRRIGDVLERCGARFLDRILTDAEKGQLPQPGQRRTEWVAGRFAAKESAAKALGTGVARGITMRDMEILSAQDGRPGLFLHGRAREVARNMGACSFHVSISHEKEMACAVVILEK